jgi:uncharacterized linocin/CFP29 family protein
MAEYLGRDLAPLSEEQWKQLDELVVGTARKVLVGRRVLPVYGPLGAGPVAVPKPQVVRKEKGLLATVSGLVELHEIAEDLAIDWKQLEQAKALGAPVEWAAAAAAAVACADREDQYIFRGCDHCGAAGLLTSEGRLEVQGRGWEEPMGMFEDAVRAVEQLAAAGHPGPYAALMSPKTRTLTHRWLGEGLMLHSAFEQLASAGVYASRHVPDNVLVVMAVGAHVADLAVGVDLTVAYLGNEGMTHLFRVFETVALRIKQPAGICVVTGA